MFFHKASMLNKITKIHDKSFKTVDARSSGLNFTTPFEPEAGLEAGIRNYQWYFFMGLVCWTKYPKFMVKASKLCRPGLQDSFPYSQRPQPQNISRHSKIFYHNYLYYLRYLLLGWIRKWGSLIFLGGSKYKLLEGKSNCRNNLQIQKILCLLQRFLLVSANTYS